MSATTDFPLPIPPVRPKSRGRMTGSSGIQVPHGFAGALACCAVASTITSIEIARSALGVTEAMVLGQILDGVPVWRLGAESRWSGIPYVVFPGNVGGDNALEKVVQMLSGGAGDEVR
jgi:hypothetical protein